MKKNKKIILIFSFLAVIILVLGLVSVFIQKNKLLQLPILPEVKEEKSLMLDTEVKTVDGQSVIDFFISPNKEELTMAAFTYKAIVKNNGIGDQSKVIKSEKLTKDAWSFPIFRLTNINPQENSGEIEVAGFRLGSTPYFITEKTLLFSINIENDSDSNVDLLLDRENTKFFTSDVVTELPY